jgi:hypothetical protein
MRVDEMGDAPPSRGQRAPSVRPTALGGGRLEEGRRKRKAMSARHVHALKGNACVPGTIRGRHGPCDLPEILWPDDKSCINAT